MNAQAVKTIRKFCKYEKLPFKAVKKEFKKQKPEIQKQHLEHMDTIIKARQLKQQSMS